MRSTKVITEGAIFAAIYALIAFMTVILPILASALIWILPLPFIIYTSRNGWKPGAMLWVVSAFVSFIIGGLVLITSAVIFGSGGIVVGELIRRKKTAFTVLLGGSLIYIANFILFFVLSIIVFDIHPIKSTQQLMLESITIAEKMLLSFGQEQSSELVQLVELIERLQFIAPSIIILTAIFYALFTQLIANSILKRIGEKVIQFKPFREWTFPKSFLWYYLVTSVFVLIGIDEGTTFFIIIWNLFPILEIAMTIQGLAVVFFYCHVKRFSKSVMIIIVVVSLIAPFLLYIYRILGIIDLGFELRKKITNSK